MSIFSNDIFFSVKFFFQVFDLLMIEQFLQRAQSARVVSCNSRKLVRPHFIDATDILV